METLTAPTAYQFCKVYFSDMLVLEKIFTENYTPQKVISKDFGIPFLLLKEENKIVAFASVILNTANVSDFTIYSNGAVAATTQSAFYDKARQIFDSSELDTYKNPTHLQISINRLLNWLNP